MLFFYSQGTFVIEHPWPEPGVKYVGNGRPADDGPAPSDCHDVLIREVSPMS